MRVISLVNFKGGVGKTTLTANLAAGLVMGGRRVLAIDLDPQSNLTFSFCGVDYWARNLKEKRTIKRWYDEYIVNNTEIPLSEIAVEPEHGVLQDNGHLHIIPSHINMFEIDLEIGGSLSGSTERQSQANFLRVLSRLKNSLAEVHDNYDVVLIDCPPAFNTVTQSALVASDYYIIPSKPDYLSTLGLETLMGHVRRLHDRYNRCVEETEHGRPIAPVLSGVVFTMVAIMGGEPVRAQANYIDKTRQKYPVYNTLIRENKTMYADAPEYGVPVVLRPAYGDTYRQVRDELLALVQETAARCGL